MTDRTYVVEVTGPLSGDPSHLYIRADCANNAVKAARREMRNRGYDRHDGPFYYRATLHDEMPAQDKFR